MPAEEKKMGKFVRTTFGYKTSADIELDLKEGDVLKVLKEDDSGWWQGEINGRIGRFPFSCTEVTEESVKICPVAPSVPAEEAPPVPAEEKKMGKFVRSKFGHKMGKFVRYVQL